MVQRNRLIDAKDLISAPLRVSVPGRPDLLFLTEWFVAALPRAGDEINLTTLGDLGAWKWNGAEQLWGDPWATATPDGAPKLQVGWKVKDWVGVVTAVRHSASDAWIRTSIAGDPTERRVWGRSATLYVEAGEPPLAFPPHIPPRRLSDEEYRSLRNRLR